MTVIAFKKKPILKIVILDSPYETWDEEITRKLFCEIMSLRFTGYKSKYRDGILPANETDFIATHKLICEEKNGNLIPLLGNATVTVQKALHHNLSFPGLNLVRASGSHPHIEVMERILNRCQKENKTIGYDGSYTISPAVISNRTFAQSLHQTFQAMKVHFLNEYKIDECITAATVKFHVEKICKFWGYKAFEDSGRRLADIPISRVDQGLCTMMHLKKLDPFAIEAAKEFKKMWDARITITAKNEKMAKAA